MQICAGPPIEHRGHREHRGLQIPSVCTNMHSPMPFPCASHPSCFPCHFGSAIKTHIPHPTSRRNAWRCRYGYWTADTILSSTPQAGRDSFSRQRKIRGHDVIQLCRYLITLELPQQAGEKSPYQERVGMYSPVCILCNTDILFFFFLCRVPVPPHITW